MSRASDDQRRIIGRLTEQIRKEVLAAVGAIDLDDLDAAAAELAEALEDIVDKYGSAAASLAADWYDDLREAANITATRFRAEPAVIKGKGVQQLVGYVMGPLYQAHPDVPTASSRAFGGTQRRVVDAFRDTIMGASISDPAADGWQRETDGDACAFCEMLAGRGAVYSEESADFASHDECGCLAVPAFKGEPKPVKDYVPSSRNITDADRTRVREYIAANGI